SKKQSVLAGRSRELQEARDRLERKGAEIRPLKLNLPFHTPLLQHSASSFRKALNSCEISLPRIPVISNVTAKPYQSIAEIRELLSIQISSPVKWLQTMDFLIERGVWQVIEFGPKRILTKFFEESHPKVLKFAVEWNFEDYFPTKRFGKHILSKTLSIIATT